MYPDVSYEDSHPNFYYLSTAEHLYLLAAIQKREERAPHSKQEPGFDPVEISIPSPLTP